MKEKQLHHAKLTVTDQGAVWLGTETETAVAGESAPFLYALDGAPPTGQATLCEMCEEKDALSLRYTLPGGLEATVRLELFAGASLVRQRLTIVNRSEEAHVFTSLTSATLTPLGAGGALPWYHPDKFLLHYAHSDWTKEGQWKARTPAELGVVPACHHEWERPAATFSSCGSWSTSGFYPFFVLEEKEQGKVYFMEIEGAVNWNFELFHLGGYRQNGIGMGISAANGENGWHLTLAPGESYTTVPAVYGCTDGGLEEAVREMLVYRRASTRYGAAGQDIPLVFNDYMNCLWARPSDEVLLPLIAEAGRAGVEYFCIDAGWHKNAAPNSLGAKGDWLVADERFGEKGLAGIFAAIREAGMKPGVWFEWEAVYPSADAMHLAPDCLLTRYGKPIVKGNSYHFNMRCPAVRAHLHARVDALYDMGVRYIKNDYNADTGCGTDMYGTSPAEGTRLAMEALYSFVEEVKAKHPDLLIENCGSGAMREDNGTLCHFDLQSTSDQECYENYPSILTGSLCYLAPEKAGIWAYPYPLTFDAVFGKQPKVPYAEMADGENMIFNLVSGMCGAMYLSGHLEHMDEENRALLHEGVCRYKEIRRTIASATPVFPLPQLLLNEDGFAAQGLLSQDGQELLLAVWRIRAAADTVTIPLAKYAAGFKAEMLYPSDPRGGTFSYNGRDLTVTLPKSISARYFRLRRA